MQLNAELQLVSDLDALGICVLQTAGQSGGHIQIARKLVSLRSLVDNLNVVVIHLIVVGQDSPSNLVSIAYSVGILRVEGQVVAFNELGAR